MGAARIADHALDADVAITGFARYYSPGLTHYLGIGRRALGGSSAITPTGRPGAHRHDVAVRNAQMPCRRSSLAVLGQRWRARKLLFRLGNIHRLPEYLVYKRLAAQGLLESLDLTLGILQL